YTPIGQAEQMGQLRSMLVGGILSAGPRMAMSALPRAALPQGVTQAQMNEAAALIRSRAGNIGGEAYVHGSRAANVAKSTSDVDLGIRVSPERYNQLIRERFGTPNPGSAYERTMNRAIESGKIDSGEAGLRALRKDLERIFGRDVDLSVIRAGSRFDN